MATPSSLQVFILRNLRQTTPALVQSFPRSLPQHPKSLPVKQVALLRFTSCKRGNLQSLAEQSAVGFSKNLSTQAIFSSSLAAETTTSNPTSSSSASDNNESEAQGPSWRASLDFKWMRDNKELIAQNIKNRNADADVEKVVQIYDKTFVLAKEVEKFRAERNNVASMMKGKLNPEKRQELIEEGKRLKEVLAELEAELAALSEQLQREGQRLPNMTHPNVPIGEEDEAAIRKEVGSKRSFNFPVKNHVELGEALGLIDFEAAAEVSGNKFYYLKNEAMLLEMALLNWTVSELVKRGFLPLSTPDLVRSSVIEKCGFQPRGPNTQVYSVEGTDLCLAGTAEIPIGGMFMDRILSESELPLKLAAFSHCFRTEAGAAGAATRGLYRVHQFSKLEMFVLCKPEDSDSLHEELISIEEDLFTSLGLHFKTLDMPSVDLGAPAYRKYDVEAWMPGLDRYGEISSASNCTDYQSRRLNIRYRPIEDTSDKPKKGKGPPLRFVHTLNATACAVPRMIIALLENFQQEDGSVCIPKVLQQYMGGREQIPSKAK